MPNNHDYNRCVAKSIKTLQEISIRCERPAKYSSAVEVTKRSNKLQNVHVYIADLVILNSLNLIKQPDCSNSFSKIE